MRGISTVTADKLWQSLRHALQSIGLSEEDFFIEPDQDSDDEDDSWQPAVEYRFYPTKATNLDFTFRIYDYGIEFQIGPLSRSFAFEEYDFSVSAWVRQITTTLQLLLNGQLSVIITESPTRGWQAAELVLDDFIKQPMVIFMSANFQLVGTALKARLLRNSQLPDHLVIPKEFIFLPPKKNGSYITGRSLEDLKALSPLDYKTFKRLEQAIDLRMIGGRVGENWSDYFYRTAEFWLVTISIVIAGLWVMDQIPGDSWLAALQRLLVVLSAIAIITGSSYMLLKLRQNRFEQGKRSLFEPIEQYGTFRFLVQLACLSTVFAALYLPLWTPAGNTHDLFRGIDIIMNYHQLIAIGCTLLVFAALSLYLNGLRRKILFLLAYAAGFGTLMMVNALFMNTSDEAPQLAFLTAILIMGVPIVVLICAVASFWVKPKVKPAREWIDY